MTDAAHTARVDRARLEYEMAEAQPPDQQPAPDETPLPPEPTKYQLEQWPAYASKSELLEELGRFVSADVAIRNLVFRLNNTFTGVWADPHAQWDR